MTFGTQLCKWILIILVNLLRCVPCTSLTWWRNADVTEIMPFTVHVTLSPCCRERRQEFIPPENDVAIQFARFESCGLQHLGYPSREGLPFVDPWCEGAELLKERLLRESRLLDHTIIAAEAIAQWRSSLNACVRVNGGHFEHKFWACDFLLCFVCFIDTGFRKCDRYKHVHTNISTLHIAQSANIGVKCVTFVSEIFTRYGSNITKVWQKILKPITLAFSCKVVHEKLWKSTNVCNSYGKKISGTFLCGHGV